MGISPEVCHVLLTHPSYYSASCIQYDGPSKESVMHMATKSILKDIKIKDKQLAHAFIDALEQAESSKYKPTQVTRECKELTGDNIKDFFGYW